MKRFYYCVRQTAYTLFSFCFFLVSALELTLRGFLLLTIGGKSDEHKLKYHKILQKRAQFVIHHIPGTTFTFSNPSGENFEKPSIIISNHQAHIDLMGIMMLTPKMVILTKSWVWHNPFYGLIIRYADYLPVSDVEQSTDKLRALVDKGYSVMIFPEGTRSEDCRLKRFHRGAFYMAEQLHLDIVPVMIKGFGTVLPKKSFHLHPGALSLEVLPRITRQELDKMGDYREVARKIHAMYMGKDFR